jgi:uncharacterized protein (DUF1778 family)
LAGFATSVAAIPPSKTFGLVMTSSLFILDATRRAAEETLLDRALLRVDSDALAAFQARLDAPPHGNERLCKTMQSVPPWEKP